MSDDEKLQVLRGQVLSPNDPMHQPLPISPAPPGHTGILNIWGRLRVYANQRGFERYQKMIAAYEGAELALANLMKAKEARQLQAVRLEQNNLEELKESERSKIRQQRNDDRRLEFEHEIRMRELEYRKHEAEIKIEGIKHDREMAELRRKMEKRDLEAALYGKPIKANDELSREEQLAQLLQKARKFHDDYAAACQASPDMSQEEKDMWRRQEQAIQDEIERFSAS